MQPSLSEEKRQSGCLSICKASDGEKQHELLPMVQEVKTMSVPMKHHYHKTGGQNWVLDQNVLSHQVKCRFQVIKIGLDFELHKLL